MTAAPSDAARAVADDLAFDEIAAQAALASSYWRSIGEAARRRELMTVAVHLRQVRLVTDATHEIVKTFDAEAREGEEEP